MRFPVGAGSHRVTLPHSDSGGADAENPRAHPCRNAGRRARRRPGGPAAAGIDLRARRAQRGHGAASFMVAAANPLATQAGYDVLAAGGSAADAAVAVQMVLNVVEPQSSGIGGGAFALYWDAALGELTTFDGRETAPAAATPDYWLGPDGTPREFWDALVGGRSVGVPGTLKLMERLHADYGRLPWGELFAPRSPSPRTASRSPSASPPRSSRRTTTRSTASPPPARSTSTRTAPRSSRARSCATPTSPAPSGWSPPRAASLSTRAPSPATSSPPSAPRPIPACSPSGTSPATR